MDPHGYASAYAEVLSPYLGKSIRLAEIGILQGTGLAVWSSVFPDGELHGLDIDTSNFSQHVDRFRALGAFANNMPTIHTLDQFSPDPQIIRNLGELDVVIDDGCHHSRAIMTTMRAFAKVGALPSVYIVEDNANVHIDIRKQFPEAELTRHGNQNNLTVVRFPPRLKTPS